MEFILTLLAIVLIPLIVLFVWYVLSELNNSEIRIKILEDRAVELEKDNKCLIRFKDNMVCVLDLRDECIQHGSFVSPFRRMKSKKLEALEKHLNLQYSPESSVEPKYIKTK